LREAQEIQQKSNECLQGVMSLKTGSGESLPAELANGLYSQIESLQSQLKVAQDEKERLRQQFDQRNAELVTDIMAEQKLADLQLRVSRERAEISRQRAELTRLKVDLVHRRVAEPPETSVSDSHDRVSAMDVHLRALHHGELLQESSPIENDDGEVASRVTNLLHRVSTE
jgi:multidrug efflux pump subunit AcrA (membrane-fusion protein)